MMITNLQKRARDASADVTKRRADYEAAERALMAADPDDAKRWAAADAEVRRTGAALARAEQIEREAAADAEQERRAKLAAELEALIPRIGQTEVFRQLDASDLGARTLETCRRLQALYAEFDRVHAEHAKRHERALEIARELNVSLPPECRTLPHAGHLRGRVRDAMIASLTNKPNPHDHTGHTSAVIGGLLPGGW